MDESGRFQYGAFVEIIEARELVPAEGESTMDPMVEVDIAGQKVYTEILKKTTSPMWNSQQSFNNLRLHPSEFDAAKVTIKVFDTNTIFTNVLIGQYQFDCASIYANKNHEYWKQWVMLTNTEAGPGSRGYLKLSITIVKPGESPVVHDEDEEDDEDGEGDDLASLVLKPPNLEETHYLLKVRVYRAENLPKTDWIGTIDPFVAVQFAGNPEVSTRVEKNNQEPTFDEEVRVPVVTPNMSNNIDVILYDKDVLGSAEVTRAQFKFTDIRNNPWGPGWLNLYGIPPAAGEGYFSKGKYAERTNFVGRILLRLEAEMVEPELAIAATAAINPAAEPEEEEYHIYFDLFNASDLPDSLLYNYQIEICWGPYSYKSAARPAVGEVVTFDKALDEIVHSWPKDIRYVPDIIVNMWAKPKLGIGEGYRVGYVNYNFADAMTWDAKPSWVALKPDPVNGLQDAESGQSSGFVLFKMLAGKAADSPGRVPFAAPAQRACNIIMNLYQGRDLPAYDPTGTSDPFIELRCGPYKATPSRHKNMTNYPQWYQKLTIQAKLPVDKSLAPLITVRVMDYGDLLEGGNHYLCRTEVPVTELKRRAGFPKWYKCYRDSGRLDDNNGAILASFQLQDHVPDALDDAEAGASSTDASAAGVGSSSSSAAAAAAAAAPTSSLQATKHADDIQMPNGKFCYIRVDILGLRSLMPYMFSGCKKPYIMLDTGDMSNAQTVTLDEEDDDGVNVNHLKVVHLRELLPLDDLYTPALTIRVYDDRGMMQPLIGVTSIPLQRFLPVDTWPDVDLDGVPNPEVLPTGNTKVSKSDDPLLASLVESHEKDEAKKVSYGDSIPVDVESINSLEMDNWAFETPPAGKRKGVRTMPDVQETRMPGDEDDAQKQKEPDRYPVELELTKVMKPDPLSTEVPFKTFNLYRGAGLGTRPNVSGKIKMKIQIFDADSIPADLLPTPSYFRDTPREQDEDKEDYKRRIAKDLNPLQKAYDQELSATLQNDMEPTLKVIRVYVYRALQMSRSAIIYPMVTTGDWDPSFTASGVHHRTEEKTRKPKFYECYEVRAELPGDADLRVQLYEYNVVFADELIGETVVDLEMRHYNQRWNAEELKPIEYRTLWSPSSQLPQGKVEMRVEILDVAYARAHPPDNIKPPPPKPFQMRLIVWNVYNAEYPANANKGDFMVSSQFGDQKTRELLETDTHWNSDDHEGRFNWRKLVDMDLPLEESEPHRMLLQLWDRGLISPNDALAEVNLNLKGFLKKAGKIQGEQTFPKGMPGGEKYAECKPLTSRLDMTHPVHKDPMIRAQIEVSLYWMTKAGGKKMDAGMGRDEPNQHPFLEEPPRPPAPWNLGGKFGNFFADNKWLLIGILVLGLLGAIFFFVVMPLLSASGAVGNFGGILGGGSSASSSPAPSGSGGPAPSGSGAPAPSGSGGPPPPVVDGAAGHLPTTGDMLAWMG